MLYSLFQPLARDIRIFNLLNYITFRSAAAFVTALLVSFVLGPVIIRRLRAMAVHQVVRAGTPDSHAGKGTTPTMGGLIILVASILPIAFFANIIRVIVLVLITHYLGDEAGQGYLHGLAGMVLMLAALAVLFAIDSFLNFISNIRRRGKSLA